MYGRPCKCDWSIWAYLGSQLKDRHFDNKWSANLFLHIFSSRLPIGQLKIPNSKHNRKSVFTKLKGLFGFNGPLWFYTSINFSFIINKENTNLLGDGHEYGEESQDRFDQPDVYQSDHGEHQGPKYSQGQRYLKLFHS